MTPTASTERRAGDTLALSIPPEISAVSTARLFVAAVARGLELDEDEIEDLRLAVSEAASNAVRSHRSAGVDAPVDVRITATRQTVEVEIVDAAGRSAEQNAAALDETDQGRLSLSQVVIRALYPDAEYSAHPDGGTVLRFRLARPG